MAPTWGDDATLGSGLPDRFQLTVATSVIDHPYEKNPTQAAVVITGESKVEDDISDEHLWLKPGAFEPGDKEGTFLVHETQTPAVFEPGSSEKPKKINKNSAYGKFLNSVATAMGSFEALSANQDAAREKFQIWDVKFWEGLVLDIEMVDEPYDFKNKETGEQITGSTRQPYVRAILGAGTTSAAAAPAAAASPNGAVDPATFDSHMSYLEAYAAAGGDTGDEAASKAFWQAAREKAGKA